MLTVSMPTFGTPPLLLSRAVNSVLAQTYTDLRLVVVNDGGPPLTLPDDDRLVVFDMPSNRGRYMADAVVLAASESEWFAVHDADDWSPPDKYERLILAARGSGAAVGPYVRHRPGVGDAVQRPRLEGRPSEGFAHVVHWAAGVYSRTRMLEGGGIHAGFRLGFDTLHTLMLTLTGPIAEVDDPVYHWVRRPGSLTMAPKTRIGSSERQAVKARLVRLWRDAWAAYENGDPPGRVVAGDVAVQTRRDVDRYARRLRRALCA